MSESDERDPAHDEVDDGEAPVEQGDSEGAPQPAEQPVTGGQDTPAGEPTVQDEAAPDDAAAERPTSERPTSESDDASAGDPTTEDEIDESGASESLEASADAAAQADSLLPPEDDDEPLIVRRRVRRVRTVDFSQPNKFTAELRRRIVRVLGPFCEAVAIRFSSELRTPVELAVADSSQLTWSAAKAQLPASTVAVALAVQPDGRPDGAQEMLLSIEPPVILRALECLLGGSASQAPSERRLSEVDWALTRRLLEALVAQLAPAWHDLGGLRLTLGEIDLDGDAGVLAPLGEPTFAVALECRIDGLPARMSLLIPWSTIGPVAEDIVGAGPAPEEADPQEGRAVQRGLAGAEVKLRAEVGSARMPVQQMLALQPGSLLALQERAEDGVQLYAEGVPLGRARPGLRGAHRAVKLTAALEPGRAPALAGVALARHGGRSALLSDEELVELDGAGEDAPREYPESGEPAAPAAESVARMLGVSVRVWAELGRTALPLGDTLELPPGTVLELDQSAEDPIALFVNGMPFAHGSLQVTPEGEWAVQIDALL